MNDYQDEIESDISNSNPPTVQNGTINGTSFSFINNPNPDDSDITFSWKYCFFVKNGEGIIVSCYVNNIEVLEHVVSTFN
ncbi:MAG: hypothetical protein ACLQG5_03910 [Methanobacterium sp.]|jgi:hypothetical protein